MTRLPPNESNPYRHLYREDLANLANGILLELQGQRLRTREEREDLTRRVQWLLSAYCWHSLRLKLTVAKVKGGKSLTESYMEHYAREKQSLRESIWREAGELVKLPHELDGWSMMRRINGYSLTQAARQSVFGLRAALDIIEDRWNLERAQERAKAK